MTTDLDRVLHALLTVQRQSWEQGVLAYAALTGAADGWLPPS